MNTAVITAIAAYFKSKGISILFLGLGFFAYRYLPDGMPFVELFYTALTIFSAIVAAPLVRLLVFNEAAQYAENGGLTKDLADRVFTPALLHYWFATAICYLTCIACMATVTK